MIFGYGLFIIFHPGKFFVGPESEFPKLSKAEKKAEKERKRDEKLRKKDEKLARKKGISPSNGSSNDTFEMGARVESRRF